MQRKVLDELEAFGLIYRRAVCTRCPFTRRLDSNPAALCNPGHTARQTPSILSNGLVDHALLGNASFRWGWVDDDGRGWRRDFGDEKGVLGTRDEL